MEEISQQLMPILKDFFERIGLKYSSFVFDQISPAGQEPLYLARINSDEDCSVFLGRYGENLKALEHIARVIVAKQTGEKILFSIDINGYKEERAKKVLQMAREVANRVRATQKAEVLFPMSSYERRIVHMELVSMHDVLTESVGEEPKRRVVIRPYP